MDKKKIAFNRPMTEFERGKFEMFDLITSVFYGKRYYFLQDNGMVYSRKSGRAIVMDDAVSEFLRMLEDEG